MRDDERGRSDTASNGGRPDRGQGCRRHERSGASSERRPHSVDRAPAGTPSTRPARSTRRTTATRVDAARRRGSATTTAVARRVQRTPAALFEELNWDYATIERLTPDLSTQVIAFNLGKAVLQGDEANNIALAPGDVVTVYSQKDVRVPVARQTRLVGPRARSTRRASTSCSRARP